MLYAQKRTAGLVPSGADEYNTIDLAYLAFPLYR